MDVPAGRHKTGTSSNKTFSTNKQTNDHSDVAEHEAKPSGYHRTFYSWAISRCLPHKRPHRASRIQDSFDHTASHSQNTSKTPTRTAKTSNGQNTPINFRGIKETHTHSHLAHKWQHVTTSLMSSITHARQRPSSAFKRISVTRTSSTEPTRRKAWPRRSAP